MGGIGRWLLVVALSVVVATVVGGAVAVAVVVGWAVRASVVAARASDALVVMASVAVVVVVATVPTVPSVAASSSSSAPVWVASPSSASALTLIVQHVHVSIYPVPELHYQLSPRGQGRGAPRQKIHCSNRSDVRQFLNLLRWFIEESLETFLLLLQKSASS